MYNLIARYITGIFFIGFFLTSGTRAQGVLKDPEAEFQRIRTIAYSGDLATAAISARRLVRKIPSYGDARVLLGRILAWQKDYVNAAAVIDTLLNTEPENSDALAAMRDIRIWSKDNSPASTDIRAGYSFDVFRQPYSRSWQIFKAGAGHRFGWGTASAAINTGRVALGDPLPLTATEFQFEADAYPKISSKNYAYLSFAISPGRYFPGYRAAGEIWQIFNKGWCMSAGMNYYYFDRNIFIGGLSVEKYIGKYWLSAKGFIYFKDQGPTFSFYINGRRYLKDSDYFQATVSTGTAPDEPFDIQADLMRFSASSIRLAYNKIISSKITFRVSAGYSIEEFAEKSWRNRFDGSLTVFYSLRKKDDKSY